MRIAIDGSLLGASFSGVARSVAQLVKHLPTAAGDQHEVLLFVGNAFDSYVERHHPDGFEPRLQIVRSDFDNADRFKRLVWQQVMLPGLCHAHQVDVFHAPAYFAPVLMRSPQVVTVYDLIGFEQPQSLSRLGRLYHRHGLPLGLRGAQRVIVPSAAARRAIAQYLPHAYDRTVKVPLGVEQRFFAPADGSDEEIRRRYRLPAEYLLWVGNIEPKKNVGLLLRAMQLLRERGREVPKLVIAGALSTATNEVMREFLRAGLQTRVQFVGRVRDAELPAIYRGAALFCFPSRHEGFGLPPLEAMAAGVPVIVSDAGSLPEVVGQAGLVRPVDDVEAWADGIVEVLGQPTLRDSLVARGRARALRFDWVTAARRTLAVYAAAAAMGEDEYDHRSGRILYAAD